MVCGGLRWFAVVCGGLRWFAVVCLIVIPKASGNHIVICLRLIKLKTFNQLIKCLINAQQASKTEDLKCDSMSQICLLQTANKNWIMFIGLLDRYEMEFLQDFHFSRPQWTLRHIPYDTHV